MAFPSQNNQISASSYEKKNDNFLIAGFKVTDKAGGPELFVTGFTNRIDVITPTGELKSKYLVYQKIYINIDKKTDKELFDDGDESEIKSYHFFRDLADPWNNRETGDNKLYFVC